MSESQRILNYLQDGHSLTCCKAIRMGISHNLRSRIAELSKTYPIQRKTIVVKRRGGGKASVRKYWL